MISNFQHIIPTVFSKLAATLMDAEKNVYTAPPYAAVLCRKSLEEWIRWLYENDADLEAQDNEGWRALHSAALFGHLPFIQELISRYHVDINARRNDGRTALSCARMFGRTEIITFLQANGGIDDGMEEDDDF